VHARKPGCLVCSNWTYSARQPDAVRAPVDYLSGDYDWAWGANRAAIEGRPLDGRGLSWDLMAWGFTKTGPMEEPPPWTMKPAIHLCQEAAEVVALGGGIMVYDQPQRTGWLTGWRQDIIAAVATFCRARQDACFGSNTVPQAAVLHLADHFYAHNQPLYNYGEALQPVEGALHALLETHRPTDVLTEDVALRRMSEYKLVVVPEQTRLTDALLGALEAYTRAGGHVLMSGAHLAGDYPALVDATPDGAAVDDATFLPVSGRAVAVSASWQPVTPGDNSDAWVYRLAQQELDKDATRQVIVTRCAVGAGSIVAVHGPLFQDYFSGHYPDLRLFIDGLVDRLGIAWLAEVDAPARLELILRRKEGKLLLSLINRGAGEMLSPHRVIVDELPPVPNVVARVRHKQRPASVTAVPADSPINWAYANGLVTLSLPRVDVHSVIVIE